MSTIESLLAEWKSGIMGKETNKVLALQILECAESVTGTGQINENKREFWLEFLDLTKKPEFLNALGSSAFRERWVEVVFRLLQFLNYSAEGYAYQQGR